VSETDLSETDLEVMVMIVVEAVGAVAGVLVDALAFADFVPKK
jgi:hypothetical protein